MLDKPAAGGLLDDADLVAGLKLENKVAAVVAFAKFLVGRLVLCEYLHLIAGADVAAERKLSAAAQHLHVVVAPAYVLAFLPAALRGFYPPDGEGVVSGKGKILAALVRDDEPV